MITEVWRSLRVYSPSLKRTIVSVHTSGGGLRRLDDRHVCPVAPVGGQRQRQQTGSQRHQRHRLIGRAHANRISQPANQQRAERADGEHKAHDRPGRQPLATGQQVLRHEDDQTLRAAAQRACDGSKVKVNSHNVKPSHNVKRADEVRVDTPQRSFVLVVRELAEKRLGAPQARLLYEDHSPPPPPKGEEPFGVRERGSGRPTKADRRALERLRSD